MSYLSVCNLSVFQKEKEIVKNINFNADKGELIALLGLNGSGKTTLMKGICSLLKTKGEFTIDGNSNLSTKEKELQKLIAYIPQRHSINFHISVIDMVLMGFSPKMSLFENYNKNHKHKALKALEIVEMQNFANNDFLTLSEGQKQLVILARALVQNTEFMIFDEPDSAMDFNNKHLVLAKIKKIVTQNKCGILCMHDANFALKYCTRALIMKNGEIIYDLNTNTALDEEIERALNLIYNNVKIIRIDDEKIMVKC